MGKGNACCGGEPSAEDEEKENANLRDSMANTGKNCITDPEHFTRCLTDPHMLLVFIAFLVGMAIILVTAINEGEIERILYGACHPSLLSA